MVRLQPRNVVQQRCGADDLDISALGCGDVFRQRQHAQDVVEAVGRVRPAVQGARLVDGDHEVGCSTGTGGFSSSPFLRTRSQSTPPGRLAMMMMNDIRTLTATAWVCGTSARP